MSRVRGSRVGVSKLTETEVLEIRQKYWAAGPRPTLTELASLYDVGINTLRDVVAGNTWRHVGGPTHALTRTRSDKK